MSAVLLLGVGLLGQLPPADALPVAATAAPPAYWLAETGYRPRPYLPVGRRLTTRYTVQQEVRQAPTYQVAIQSATTYVLTAVVTANTEAGIVLQTTLDRLVWQAEGGMTRGTFDSAAEAPADERAEHRAARKLIGETFVVTLDQRGAVLKVAGLRELVDRLRQQGGSQEAVAGTYLMGLVSEATLTSLFRMQFGWMPTEPIAAGQTWRTDDTRDLGSLTLRRSYTFQIAEPSTVTSAARRLTIRGQVQVASQPNDGKVVGPKHVRADLLPSPPGSSTIHYHTGLGMVETVQTEVSFRMRTTVTPIADLDKAEVIDQTAAARSTVELLSIDGQRW